MTLRTGQLLRDAGALVAVRASVRCFGLTRTRRIADRISDFKWRTPTPKLPNDNSIAFGRKLTERISFAALIVPTRALCLERSLVLYYMLRAHHFDPQFCIGIQCLPFEAHAWVELEGIPINEDPDVVATFARVSEEVS
jgi:hypothetical protein